MLPLSGLSRRAEIWHHILVNMGVTVLFVAGVKQHSGKLCSCILKSTGAELDRPTISRRRSEIYRKDPDMTYLIARLIAGEGYMGQAFPALFAAEPLYRFTAASLPLLAAHDCALGASLAHTYRILVQVDAKWLLAAPG